MTKQDPTTQYPRPPFPKQPTEAPGSVHEMTPAPDHGETSFRPGATETRRHSRVRPQAKGLTLPDLHAQDNKGMDDHVKKAEPRTAARTDLLNRLSALTTPSWATIRLPPALRHAEQSGLSTRHLETLVGAFPKR